MGRGLLQHLVRRLGPPGATRLALVGDAVLDHRHGPGLQVLEVQPEPTAGPRRIRAGTSRGPPHDTAARRGRPRPCRGERPRSASPSVRPPPPNDLAHLPGPRHPSTAETRRSAAEANYVAGSGAALGSASASMTKRDRQHPTDPPPDRHPRREPPVSPHDLLLPLGAEVVFVGVVVREHREVRDRRQGHEHRAPGTPQALRPGRRTTPTRRRGCHPARTESAAPAPRSPPPPNDTAHLPGRGHPQPIETTGKLPET